MEYLIESLERVTTLGAPQPRQTQVARQASPGVQAQAFDFVDTYATYADVYELPRQVHEAIAIVLVAAAANGNVWIELGDKRLSLDCWTLVTSASGGGRNTAVRKARSILEVAGLDKLVGNVAWGSEPIVKQYFAERPRGLMIWPEMSGVLEDLNRAQFAGVKQWITDLYDETTPPASKIYRQIKGRENTPSISFSMAPRTCFLATSSYEWLITNLSRVDASGGFLPRWMLLDLPETQRLIAIPQKSDQTLVAPLSQRLQQIAQVEGTADLSSILGQYTSWYGVKAKLFEGQSNPALAESFWNRHRDHVLKLASHIL